MPGPGTMGSPVGVNPDLQFGYKAIVSLNGMGGLKISFEEIENANGLLGFKRNVNKELQINAYSLYDVWSNIVNYADIEYQQDYFVKFFETFDRQSQSIKAEIQQLFYKASYTYDAGGYFAGEVWTRFYKKLEAMFGYYQRTQYDENIWNQISSSAVNLFYKNIFY